jgi:hypothetical protein
VVLDIDETLLNPLHKWTTHIKTNMGLDILTVQQVEYSGGLDGVFYASPRYPEFKVLIDYMRASEELNSDLHVIEGAVEGVQKLLDIPGLDIAGYLTTRPYQVTRITEIDLQAKGFPSQPVITRPGSVLREITTQWKLAVLEDVSRNYNGTLIFIDDAVSTAKALRERNLNADNAIVTILFNGPLSYTTIAHEGIQTMAEAHFYVSDWEGIPQICAEYAKRQVTSSIFQ